MKIRSTLVLTIFAVTSLAGCAVDSAGSATPNSDLSEVVNSGTVSVTVLQSQTTALDFGTFDISGFKSVALRASCRPTTPAANCSGHLGLYSVLPDGTLAPLSDQATVELSGLSTNDVQGHLLAPRPPVGNFTIDAPAKTIVIAGTLANSGSWTAGSAGFAVSYELVGRRA